MTDRTTSLTVFDLYPRQRQRSDFGKECFRSGNTPDPLEAWNKKTTTDADYVNATSEGPLMRGWPRIEPTPPVSRAGSGYRGDFGHIAAVGHGSDFGVSYVPAYPLPEADTNGDSEGRAGAGNMDDDLFSDDDVVWDDDDFDNGDDLWFEDGFNDDADDDWDGAWDDDGDFDDGFDGDDPDDFVGSDGEAPEPALGLFDDVIDT